MKAQWLVEYALILFLVAVVALVIWGLVINIGNNVCSDPLAVKCKIARVQECVALELYTEDQCIALIGGGGKP